MLPNSLNEETAYVLNSIFHDLFASPFSWRPPVIAQIDESSIHFKNDHLLLSRQEPDDIIRCWVWEEDGPQPCSVAEYIKRKQEAEGKGTSHGLLFAIKRTSPDRVNAFFFWKHLGGSPLHDMSGLGLWVRKEGKWIAEQLAPTLWGF
jgi:hypothetical protein